MDASLSQPREAPSQGVTAFRLPGHHVVEVLGPDATTWLDALITTGVVRMPVGEARWSFLLQPTGRTRASFAVARIAAESYLLVQPPGQPKPIEALLGMYRLSSQVSLDERDEVAVLVPAWVDTNEIGAWRARFSPSSVHHLPPGGPWELVGGPRDALEAQLVGLDLTITDAEASTFTAAGVATFPTDLGPDALPLEAAEQLGDAIDHEKGCYLGQEAIAKTRNFGRTPFTVLAFRASGPVRPGSPLLDAEGADAGSVTSVASGGAVLARVRVKSVGSELRAPDGTSLTPI